MTYFDRNSELTDAAVREILTALGDTTVLTLMTPFRAEFQTGQSGNIVAILKKSENDIEFQLPDRIVPVARLEVATLMKLVDQIITPRLFD